MSRDDTLTKFMCNQTDDEMRAMMRAARIMTNEKANNMSFTNNDEREAFFLVTQFDCYLDLAVKAVCTKGTVATTQEEKSSECAVE